MNGIKPPKLGTGIPKPPTATGAPKPGGTALSVANPLKTGEQSTVKMPKIKTMPSMLKKPSLFFKTEVNTAVKKPSIEKLKGFLERTRAKKIKK